MTGKTKKIYCVVLALAATVVAFHSVYLLGQRNGCRDALDWNFSAVVDGKLVQVGHGSTLLGSREQPKPVRNVNMVSGTFSAPASKP